MRRTVHLPGKDGNQFLRKLTVPRVGYFVPTLILSLLPVLLLGIRSYAQIHRRHAEKAFRQRNAFATNAQPRPRAAVYASSQGEPASKAMAARFLAEPTPAWAVYELPRQATVSWENRSLRIEASNSSLNQILLQVAAVTGARLEGVTKDQRIFGTYGPGPGYDVLSSLLEGSGYNVLILSSREAGAPISVVLSARKSAGPQIAANSPSHSRPELPVDQLQSQGAVYPPQGLASDNPFANGEQPGDPLQFMQEILQRQEKIDQQQQQKPAEPPLP